MATTPSITSWVRLEPRCRDIAMREAVRARVWDPLWLLARQWQTAEFQGEDAGTPVVARVRARSAMLSRCHLGDLPANTPVQGRPYDPRQLPLETLIERQRLRPRAGSGPDKLKLVVEAGLHFLRLLATQPLSKSYRETYITRYALTFDETQAATLDPASVAFLRSMAGRVPDARRLEAAFRGGGVPDAALKIKAADRAEVELAAQRWLAWVDTLFSEARDGDAEAWLPERLEHAASVAARLSPDRFDERTLATSELCEGELDWSDFDLDLEVNLGTDAASPVDSLTQTVVPAPITFRGAPAARFWEFEDAQIDFGLMPVGPGELAQLLMIDYASSWGNDWFVVPLDLAVGSLTAVDSLVVADTFGVRSLLRPLGDRALAAPHWSMFQLAHRRRAGALDAPQVASNLFFLPPTLARSLQGAALEDVLFMRDEMANMAWAIERAVEGPLETALRHDTVPPEAADEPDATPGGLPRYRLASTVPPAWIPLLPVQLTAADGQMQSRLQRGAVLRPDGSKEVQRAQSRLLNLVPRLLLHDEEVPREGVRVTRQVQLARWTDGSTLCWLGQRTAVGRGEGSSGLRFDRIEASDEPTT
jgi:hypothetical protein